MSKDNYRHWRVDARDEYCVLVFDKQDSTQNVLSSEVMQELGQALSEIEQLNYKGLIVQSGKQNGFIAGADVSEFEQVSTPGDAQQVIKAAHEVINRLENLKCPTVALINGHCLGGGLELALACNYRISIDEPSCRIGLPEVLLGIHPGFGGTVRLIEKTGVPAAMDLMLSGRTVVPAVAKKMGIIDLAVPERQLMRAAEQALSGKIKTKNLKAWQKWLNLTPARAVMASVLEKKVAEKASRDHYPAPYQLIKLWKEHGGSRAKMLEAEIDSVCKLVATDTSRNLVKVFFLQEELKKLGKSETKKQEFEHVHVIGAGVMGGDIASWCALRGLTVTLHDRSPEALAKASKRAYSLFKRKLRKDRLVQRAMDRFMPDLQGIGAKNADVIIEAIFENAEAKIGVFADLQKVAKPDAILATNTSSIPLETISNALTKPGRLVGLHFFNPVAKMQLVEVVQGDKTYAKVLTAANRFAGKINRLPVPVKSSPGFLVNRVLMPYLLEAVELVKEGVAAEAIDQAATDFGMPMGPITLADTVGLDICLHVAENLTQAFGGEVPTQLQQKVEAGHLGKKSGKGFYDWKNDKPQKQKQTEASTSPSDMTDRLIFRYLNECIACMNENIIEDVKHADAGLIFGTGFAPFRGGPMNYIHQQGQSAMLERLQKLSDKYGERFKPDAGWEKLDLQKLLHS